MTWRRAAHYTWKAFLTFLLVGIPGLVIQMAASWVVGSWTYGDSDGRPSATMMGWASAVRGLSGLWVQFAVIFVIFKYGPEAFLEVQENRAAVRARQSSEVAPDLEQ